MLGKIENIEAQKEAITGYLEANSIESMWIKRDARVRKLIDKSSADRERSRANRTPSFNQMNGVTASGVINSTELGSAGRIRTFPCCSDSAYDSVRSVCCRLWSGMSESEAEAEEPNSDDACNRACDWFILWLLLVISSHPSLLTTEGSAVGQPRGS